MRPYTTITAREAIGASSGDCCLIIGHGDGGFALDGLDGNALRGIAQMLCRAADLTDSYAQSINDGYGQSKFVTTYEIEWIDQFKPWSLDDSLEPHGRNLFSVSEDGVWLVADAGGNKENTP